jgi:hypothetical protein
MVEIIPPLLIDISNNFALDLNWISCNADGVDIRDILCIMIVLIQEKEGPEGSSRKNFKT